MFKSFRLINSCARATIYIVEVNWSMLTRERVVSMEHAYHTIVLRDMISKGNTDIFLVVTSVKQKNILMSKEKRLT